MDIRLNHIGLNSVELNGFGLNAIGMSHGGSTEWFQLDVTPLDSKYKLIN